LTLASSAGAAIKTLGPAFTVMATGAEVVTALELRAVISSSLEMY